MSCNNCPPPDDKHTKESKPNPDDKSLSARAFQLTSAILPEGLALLSCSCCWLPVCPIFLLNIQNRKSHLTRPRLSLISSLPVPLLPPRYLAYRTCVMSFWSFQSCPLLGVFGVKAWVAGWYVGLLFLGVWLLGGSIANESRLQGDIMMDIIAVTESGYSYLCYMFTSQKPFEVIYT